jgi:hypothetical protein
VYRCVFLGVILGFGSRFWDHYVAMVMGEVGKKIWRNWSCIERDTPILNNFGTFFFFFLNLDLVLTTFFFFFFFFFFVFYETKTLISAIN